MLSYLTRGGDTPKGKLNILLLLHRLDREVFLNDLSFDVLSVLDAAVWYSDGKTETDYHLDEMNLVILPVSTAMISDFSSVRAVYDEALERRIPVLPILMDRIPTEEYGQLFGAVQYIDRFSTDLPITYMDSLRGYLSKYEKNTSLRERIAKELDANVFVSYRHKDREIMKSLIEMIHDDPRCRDIGVWYDDMLTAGNDFNNEILDSVRAADVFILAVTPALLESGNYVAVTEYPTAVSESIPVIPVMMVDTPMDMLCEMYPGLPEICEPEKIGERLSTLLDGKLDRENDTDADHLYYVGLAFVLGSSVETNVKRGIDILRKASQLGHPDANRWLATLISDDDESLDYRIQFFNYCFADYKSKNDVDSLSALFDAATSYVRHFIVRKTPDKNDIAKKIITEIAKFVESHPIAYVLELFYDALMLGYEYCTMMGEADIAQTYLDISVRVASTLYEETELSNRFKYYVDSHLKKAELHMLAGELEKANEYIISNVMPVLSVLEDDTSFDNRELRELAVHAYSALSDLCHAMGDYRKAAQATRHVVELYESLDMNNPTRDYSTNIYYNNVSVITEYLNADMLTEAEGYLPILEGSQEKMLRGVSTEGRLEHDIKLFVLKARIERKYKRFRSAEAYLKKAEKIARENDQHLTESSFHEIHFAYSILYLEWGKSKSYLYEYHSLLSFRNYAVRTAERGNEDDYDKLASAMPKPYGRIGLSDEVKKWKAYRELAKKRSIEFYPDDSHLEGERDKHLSDLLLRGIANLILLAIVVAYVVLDYNYAFVFKDKTLLCLAMIASYYISGPTACEAALYLFYRIKRKSEYSATWAFKFAIAVKRGKLILQPLLAISVIPVLTLSDRMASNGLLLFVLPLLWVGLTRTLSVLDKCMEMERLRAFERASRFKPLSEQPTL